MVTPFPYVSLTDARDILRTDGRIQHCVDVLKEVELEFGSGQYNRDSGIYEGGTRAGIRADLWYRRVTPRLHGLPGVGRDGGGEEIVARYRGQRYISFDERVSLRIKKLGKRDLLSRNYPTNQAERYIRQRRLPGLPDYARLTFGYRTDETELLIQDAFVLLRYGEVNLWLWQVWGASVDTYGVQEAIPGLYVPDPVLYFYEDLAPAG